MKRYVLKIVFASLILPLCAQADSITFTSDANIQNGDNWAAVWIYDTPPNHTTVTMTGGSVTDVMDVFDAATLNMSGGSVLGLGACNYSNVNISGGTVTGLDVFDNATATISQNVSIYTAGAYSGIINMNGGTITYLSAVGGAPILNLRGGTITGTLGTSTSFATINIFGYNLVKTASGGTLGDGQVTGFWQNDVPFTINLHNSDTYACINLIPEPATFLLFGIGTFLFRRLR